MKQFLAIGIMLLFVGMAFTPASGIDLGKQSIGVTLGRDTLYVGGSGTGNYSTIQDAIDDASDGDTVFVYNDSSPYIENVVVNKSINLIGEDKDSTVIDGNMILNKYIKDSKAVITVDDDGDGDYTSIQDAIDNATVGDTIKVYSGTYTETDILVNKQLILQGIDSELGGGGGTGKPLIINSEDDKKVIMATSDGCSISGFHIRSTGCCSRGIYLYQSNNHHVYQNEIDNINDGIILRESSNNKVYENEVTETTNAISNSYISHNNEIYDNFVYDSGYGIRIFNYAENITVYNNTVIEINAVGIGVSKSNKNTIHGNKITACGYGVELWMDDEDYGYRNTVYDNHITSCERGISVTGRDHKIYNNDIINCEYGLRMKTLFTSKSVYCRNNTVYKNNIISSGDTGLWLDHVYTTDIYWNNITHSEIWGLLIEQSERDNIFENNITYNHIGIQVYDSEENVIYHNNFIGNTENAWCYGNPRHNKWNLGYTNDGGGNYWDDYKGEDSNGDNVGDTPYIIPDYDENPFNNDRDKYPLMEPDGRPNSKSYAYTKDNVKIIKGKIEQNNISNNSYFGIGLFISFLNHINYNNIYDNGGFEPSLDSSGVMCWEGIIDVRNNWWGSSRGPSLLLFPDRGDKLVRRFGLTSFRPWATEPIPDAGVQ